jgi:hypothetical protein
MRVRVTSSNRDTIQLTVDLEAACAIAASVHFASRFMKPSSGSQSESRNRWGLRQGIRCGEYGARKANNEVGE